MVVGSFCSVFFFYILSLRKYLLLLLILSEGNKYLFNVVIFLYLGGFWRNGLVFS